MNGTTGPPPSAYPAYPHATGYLDITVQHVRPELRLSSPGRPAAIRINGENVHLPRGLRDCGSPPAFLWRWACRGCWCALGR